MWIQCTLGNSSTNDSKTLTVAFVNNHNFARESESNVKVKSSNGREGEGHRVRLAGFQVQSWHGVRSLVY